MTIKTAVFGVTLFCAAAGMAWSDDVFVNVGRQQGQAITRMRGNECFLISAAHIFESPETISLVDSQRRRTTAQIERRYKEDLVVLKADDSKSATCASGHWPEQGSISGLLSSSTSAVLRSRNEDGSRSQIAVRIVDYDDRYINVESVDGRQILRTWSGGTLVIGSEVSGILLADTPRGGRVIRREWVNDLLRSFFALETDAHGRVEVEIHLDNWAGNGGGAADFFLHIDGDYQQRLNNQRSSERTSVSLSPGVHSYEFEDIDLYDSFGHPFPGSSGFCKGFFTVSRDQPVMKILLMPDSAAALKSMQAGRAGKLRCNIVDPARAESEIKALIAMLSKK